VGVVTDVGSVVDAGSAGTTVTGSASDGCDMMGASLQENGSERGDKTRRRQKKKKKNPGRIFSKHTFSALRLDQEKRKTKMNEIDREH